MIPTPEAGHNAAALLAELGPHLSRDERDALVAVQTAADYRTHVDGDIVDQVGRALRKREAQAWTFGVAV